MYMLLLHCNLRLKFMKIAISIYLIYENKYNSELSLYTQILVTRPCSYKYLAYIVSKERSYLFESLII